MDEPQSIEDWARSVQFTQPLRWGEVEAAICARRAPLKAKEPLPRRSRWLSRLVVRPFMVLATVLVAGGGVLGLGLVTLGTKASDDGTGEVLLALSRFAFFGAAGCSLALLAGWREQKRRPYTGEVPLAGVTAVACGISTLLLWPSPRAGQFLPLLTAAVTALSLGVFLAMLVGSRGKLPGNPWSHKPSYDVQDRINRKKVLQILVQRGVAHLDTAQQAAMHEMPVGSWHQLDDGPG